MKKLRIVFMGTPQFALSILEKIHESNFCEIVGVYTQPDRPAGRGKKLTQPPVKIFAEEQGYPVLQPFNFNDQKNVINLQNLKPDFLIVAAYGIILPQNVLDIPQIAPINVHASLLPKYRGAAPVQRAILNMDDESGVSIMKMELGLDTGPVYSYQVFDLIKSSLSSEELLHEFAQIGSEELLRVLQSFVDGNEIIPIIQDDAQSSYAAKLKKSDGNIDWSKPAKAVHAQVRSVIPWPAPKLYFTNTKLQYSACTVGVGRIGSKISDWNCIEEGAETPKVGEFWLLKDGNYAIATQDFWYILDTVRPTGKREMKLKDFVNGYYGEGLVSEFSFYKGKNSLAALDRILTLSEIKG